MELCEVQLKLSSNLHPQSYETSEIMNKMVKSYLRCYQQFSLNFLDELLPGSYSSHNSAISNDLGMSWLEIDPQVRSKATSRSLSRKVYSNEPKAKFRERLKSKLNDAR